MITDLRSPFNARRECKFAVRLLLPVSFLGHSFMHEKNYKRAAPYLSYRAACYSGLDDALPYFITQMMA